MQMIKGKVTQYEDFKYVMQDTGSIFLGARYSYRELLEAEAVPFKLKANSHALYVKGIITGNNAGK